MIIKSETQIREVEKIVDQYYQNLKLVSLTRQNALLYALKIFEDFCRLPGLEVKIPLDKYDAMIHENLDALAIVVKWIFSSCKEDNTSGNHNQTLGSYYRYAMSAHMAALKYYRICTAYTSWSRGYMEAELDNNKKKLTFTSKSVKRINLHAVDIILFQQNKFSFADRFTNELEYIKPQVIPAYDELRANIKIENKSQISYKVTPFVWNTFHYSSDLQIKETFELPAEWKFSSFTIQELKLFWGALLTKAKIHDWACVNAGAQGVGIDSALIIISPKELSYEIERRVGLSHNKALDIIKFLTYNPSINNRDIAWQPLISLDSNKLAIAPHLIICNNAERNVISLINKVEQATYSRLSSMKEDIMASELRQYLSREYPHLLFGLKKNLPGTLPDMDFLIYDSNNRFLLIAELKWLLSVASAQETFARELDLQKGVSQAKKIRDYVNNNVGDCLMRAFGKSTLPVDETFVCVVSKHNTGSVAYDNNVSVISEHVLRELIDKHEGNIRCVVASIRNEEYFPKVGQDFRIGNKIFKYAGYKFSTPQCEVVCNE